MLSLRRVVGRGGQVLMFDMGRVVNFGGGEPGGFGKGVCGFGGGVVEDVPHVVAVAMHIFSHFTTKIMA